MHSQDPVGSYKILENPVGSCIGFLPGWFELSQNQRNFIVDLQVSGPSVRARRWEFSPDITILSPNHLNGVTRHCF